MAHFDSTTNTVNRWRPRWSEQYPTWVCFDCGCSGGLAWGGESPRECRDCAGNGWLYVHVPSHTVAVWPGGPLVGWRLSDDEVRKIVADAGSPS